MRKVQGAGFGVRFYRRGTVKTAAKETVKVMPKEEPAMKQEFIQTRIPDASRQLWHSTWVDVQERQKEAASDMPGPLAAFSKAVSEVARLTAKQTKFRAKPVPAPAPQITEDDQAVLREIAAMAKAAYEKVLSAPKVGYKEQSLWDAARSGDCAKIRRLVMEGVDLEARDPQGRTAINIASQYRQQDAMKTLLAAKEMRYMAKLGDLPDTKFFRKFAKTGS